MRRILFGDAGAPGARSSFLAFSPARLDGRPGALVGQGLPLPLEIPLDLRQGRGRLAGMLLLDLLGDEPGRNLTRRAHCRRDANRLKDLGPAHRRQNLWRGAVWGQDLGNGRCR